MVLHEKRLYIIKKINSTFTSIKIKLIRKMFFKNIAYLYLINTIKEIIINLINVFQKCNQRKFKDFKETSPIL